VPTVDDYLDALEPAQRAEYDRVRAVVERLAPGAVAVLSYGMPTFDYRGKHLIHFGAFKHHLSLFPPTTTFTLAEPLSDGELTAMVTRRLAEIGERPAGQPGLASRNPDQPAGG